MKKSEENNERINKEIEDHSIYNKTISINKEILDKISLANMEDFFCDQIEGLFKHYQEIFGKYNAGIKSKAKYINETINKFDLKKFTELKKQLDDKNIIIDKKIQETTMKKKLIEDGINKMKDSLAKLDGKMENLKEYSTLKAFFSKQLEDLRIMQIDAKDIKQEIYKIKKDDQKFKVLNQTLDFNFTKDKDDTNKLNRFITDYNEIYKEIREAYQQTIKNVKKLSD